MIGLDKEQLNHRQRSTLRTLAAYAVKHPAPTIVEAAAICGCSVAHVSRSVRKAGWPGYKQYIRYLYFRETPRPNSLGEIERLKRFLDRFEPGLVAEFAGLFDNHSKIILFGYGPSLICAQYVEYKLRFCTRAYVATAPDEHSALSMIDARTLLVILTATGRYRSFRRISQHARGRGAEVVVVSEEYNPSLADLPGRYIFLTEHQQPGDLAPHEKSRAVFFIFFEQVIQRILAGNKRADPDRSGFSEHP